MVLCEYPFSKGSNAGLRASAEVERAPGREHELRRHCGRLFDRRRDGQSVLVVRRVRAAAVGLAGALAALAIWVSPASATTLPSGFTGPCPTYPTTPAGAMQVCSGDVTSFDGTRLDVDLTRPLQGTGTRHPLIVMLHGFGNNKREWESTSDDGDGGDKYHWNSHWFGEHGYYVLTYPARGFRTQDPPAAYQPPTPPGTSGGSTTGSPNATIHVKSRDYEIRDTQWLAALVAATYADVDP